MIFLVGIIAGLALPIQTSINSELRFRVKSPYLASTISMCVAAVFMVVLGLISGQPLFFSVSKFTEYPWWTWLGGFLGDVALTLNVMLLPHLGAVQTIIMPLVGQIVTSMLIDNFGWFGLPVHSFSWLRLLGIAVIFFGVYLVVARNKTDQSEASPVGTKIVLWQGLGIITGVILALQTSTNGALNRTLTSPISAGAFSFVNGAIIMLVAVGILEHDFDHVKWAVGKGNPWYIWLGGFLGAAYTVGNLFLAPLIGTGTAVVLVLLGNMIGSSVIDKFGLLDNPKRVIDWRKYAGLVILLLGVLAVKFF